MLLIKVPFVVVFKCFWFSGHAKVISSYQSIILLLTRLFAIKIWYLLLLLNLNRRRSSLVWLCAAFDKCASFLCVFVFSCRKICCEWCCVLDEWLCGTITVTVIVPHSNSDPLAVQPVASRHTGCAPGSFSNCNRQIT